MVPAANYLQPGVASLLHDTVSGILATAIDSENAHWSVSVTENWVATG